MTPNDPADSTKERLMDVAESLFAQKGYRSVSVREITNEANCNLAAVNYHFGNKQNLYNEIFRSRWVPRTVRIRNAAFELLSREQTPSTESVVRALARAFLRGPLTDEELVHHFQLIARELAQPTEALDIVFEMAMQPFLSELASRLGETLSDRVKPEQLLLSVISIFAAVLYFNFAREAVIRLTGHPYDASFRQRLEDHITAFSLHGLSSFAAGGDE